MRVWLYALLVPVIGVAALASGAASAAAWTQQTTVNPSAVDNVLRGVSCATGSECEAVGSYYNASTGKTEPLAERWEGVNWELETPPMPPGAKSATLNSVSCTSSSFCMAAGSYFNSSGEEEPFGVEYLAPGTWELVMLSPPAGSIASRFKGVSCASSSTCAGVGGYELAGGKERPLIEQWTSSSGTWSQETAHYPLSSAVSTFNGVSCAYIEECVAVGAVRWGGGGKVLVNRGIGAPLGWSWMKTAGTTLAFPSLTSVDCRWIGITRCNSVGFGSSGGANFTLAEVWTEGDLHWSSWPTLDPSATSNVFNGVSCSEGCIAVGGTFAEVKPKKEKEEKEGEEEAEGQGVALIEWLTGGAPNLETPASLLTENWLNSVSCLHTGGRCTAVGAYLDGSGHEQTLAEGN